MMGSSVVTGYTVGVYFKMLSEHDAKAAKSVLSGPHENRRHGEVMTV